MSNNVPNYSLQEISFLGSFPYVQQAPESKLPEFAFIGRSNVGKSSLINYLCDRKKLAKISSTPGKTQHINLFSIDNKWMLADLPGYGFAKISKKIKRRFGGMIETYLQQRDNLVTVFLLLDLRHDPQKPDLEEMEWLGENGIPFSMIFTKADKVSANSIDEKVQTYLGILRETYETLPNYFVSSAAGRIGREEILDYINYVAHT